MRLVAHLFPFYDMMTTWFSSIHKRTRCHCGRVLEMSLLVSTVMNSMMELKAIAWYTANLDPKLHTTCFSQSYHILGCKRRPPRYVTAQHLGLCCYNRVPLSDICLLRSLASTSCSHKPRIAISLEDVSSVSRAYAPVWDYPSIPSVLVPRAVQHNDFSINRHLLL